MSDFDPPAPPDSTVSSLRAKDLKNQPVIIRPDKIGQGTRKADGEIYEFISCTVWRFDRAGVTDSSAGVQVSWWRVKEQLAGFVGTDRFIAGKPVETADNSIVIQPLEGAAREVAEKVIVGIRDGSVEDPYKAVPVEGSTAPPPASEFDDPGSEPF